VPSSIYVKSRWRPTTLRPPPGPNRSYITGEGDLSLGVVKVTSVNGRMIVTEPERLAPSSSDGCKEYRRNE
jgi:hypothetical protein